MNSSKTALLIALLLALILPAERVSAYYDAGTQKWLNRDPIGEQGGINLYAFSFNNPITFTDAFGTDPACSGYTGMAVGLTAEQQIDFSKKAAPAAAVLSVALVALIASEGVALPIGVGALGARILGWLGLGGTAAENPRLQAALGYALREGEALSGFVLKNGEIVDAPMELGHPAIAQMYGLLQSPLSSWTLNQQAVGFSVVNEGGQLGIFGSGAFPVSPATFQQVLPTIQSYYSCSGH